jgi:hypothetical protein
LTERGLGEAEWRAKAGILRALGAGYAAGTTMAQAGCGFGRSRNGALSTTREMTHFGIFIIFITLITIAVSICL